MTGTDDLLLTRGGPRDRHSPVAAAVSSFVEKRTFGARLDAGMSVSRSLPLLPRCDSYGA
jgi:hypothetical protein